MSRSEYEPLARRIEQAYRDGVRRVVVPVDRVQVGKVLLHELADWFGPQDLIDRMLMSRLRLDVGAGSTDPSTLVQVVPTSRGCEGLFDRAIRGSRPVLVLGPDGTEPDRVDGTPKAAWS